MASSCRFMRVRRVPGLMGVPLWTLDGNSGVLAK